MALLGDETQLEAHFGTIGYSANLDLRYVHGLHRTYHKLGNHFGRTRSNSYVTWVMQNLVSVNLEIVLVSVQDRSTVCTKRTIVSEIIMDTPDGTPM
jgi:hypothetical protein